MRLSLFILNVLIGKIKGIKLFFVTNRVSLSGANRDIDGLTFVDRTLEWACACADTLASGVRAALFLFGEAGCLAIILNKYLFLSTGNVKTLSYT